MRGFRVELGEIEAVLGLHPRVMEAAVAATQGPTGDARLTACVVLKADGDEVAEVRGWLRDRLPAYLLPTSWVRLAALPRNANGKLDRQRLVQVVAEESGDVDRAYTAPRTEDERLLAEIWVHVLGVKQVGIHDSFFDLGGHSLLATHVTALVRDELGVELPLNTLFEAPTVAELAEVLRVLRSVGT